MSILIKIERCLVSRSYWIHSEILASEFIDLLLEKLQHAHTNECIRIGNVNHVSRIQVPKVIQPPFKRDYYFLVRSAERKKIQRAEANRNRYTLPTIFAIFHNQPMQRIRMHFFSCPSEMPLEIRFHFRNSQKPSRSRSI